MHFHFSVFSSRFYGKNSPCKISFILGACFCVVDTQVQRHDDHGSVDVDDDGDDDVLYVSFISSISMKYLNNAEVCCIERLVSMRKKEASKENVKTPRMLSMYTLFLFRELLALIAKHISAVTKVILFVLECVFEYSCRRFALA